MVKQFIGPIELRGMKLTEAGYNIVINSFNKYWNIYVCININYYFIIELEWMLGQAEAIPTKITKDPKPKIRDVLFSSLRYENDDVADSNDW